MKGWRVHVLLWIGGAIGICMAASWAMMQHHAHPNFATQMELNRVHDRIKEVRNDIKELQRVLLEKLSQLNGNTRRNSDHEHRAPSPGR